MSSSLRGRVGLEVGRLLSVFQELDVDGSGSLDSAEFRSAVALLSLSDDAKLASRSLFEELNLDGNGLVTHRELLTALTANGWAPEIQLYTKPSLPFVGRSTAHDSYPQHRNQSRRPYQAAAPAAERIALPFVGSTTSRDAYRAWPIEPKAQPEPASAREGLPFDGGSTTHADYPQHEIAARSQAAVPVARRTMAFEGSTTSREDFREWPLQQVERPTPGAARPRIGLPFEGTSTAHADYPAHELPRRPEPPPKKEMLDPQTFQGSTTSQDAYRAWPVEPRAQQEPASARKGLPFDARSSSRDDYCRHALPTRPVALPPAEPPAPLRFEGTTTAMDSYKHIQLPGGALPTLGVLFRGPDDPVSFCTLIRAGTPPPTRGSAIFTTVIDKQGFVVIRIAAVVGDEQLNIATLELDGVGGDEDLGSPKVEVTFEVEADLVLSVSATNLRDGNREQVIIRDHKLPKGMREHRARGE